MSLAKAAVLLDAGRAKLIQILFCLDYRLIQARRGVA